MRNFISIILLLFCLNLHAEQIEYSTPRYITGGILSFYPGFGVGHAVQGRWLDRGWIYTASEAVIVGATAVGCRGSKYDQDAGGGCVLSGALVFFIARTLEMVDAWSGYGSFVNRMNKKDSGILVDPVNQKLFYSWNF